MSDWPSSHAVDIHRSAICNTSFDEIGDSPTGSRVGSFAPVRTEQLGGVFRNAERSEVLQYLEQLIGGTCRNPRHHLDRVLEVEPATVGKLVVVGAVEHDRPP